MAALPEQCIVNVDTNGGVTVVIASTPGGTGVASITSTSPITVDSTNPTAPIIGLANSGVAAGSYTTANITVDSKGIVTSASNGSGASFTDPDIAYISSDGNDAGDGSPNNPFLTFQGAINHASDFTSFSFGAGSFGDGTFAGRSSSVVITLMARGGACTIGTISNPGLDLFVSAWGVTIAELNTVPAAAAPGNNGADGGNIQVKADSTVTITDTNSTGGAGGAGSGVAAGGDGGDGGSTGILGTVFVVNITASGGSGGSDGGAGGGSPGTAGTVTLRNCPNVTTLTPDAAVVTGAIINNVFYDNTYP